LGPHTKKEKYKKIQIIIIIIIINTKKIVEKVQKNTKIAI